MMPSKLKSERHHWWPKSLSQFWKNEGGTVGWINPSGNIVRSPPDKFGVIKNAHHIKLSKDPAVYSPWDESFEAQFNAADSAFPRLIEWLSSINPQATEESDIRKRHWPAEFPTAFHSALIESLISLAVRSPMNREALVSLAESLRGSIPSAERNALIGVNMRNSMEICLKTIGDRGKFAVLFSEEREFIFGDGFYHTLKAVAHPPMSPEMLVPLTPGISVMFGMPTSYAREPQLTVACLNPAEADILNEIVQIYAKNALFFRSQKPELKPSFLEAKHLILSDPDNPFKRLLHSIPGIPPRNTSLDELIRRYP